MKRVNVLLSAYNGEKYIDQQVDSILNQTYSNIQLYIRDDGSTDGTLESLKKYQDVANVHIIEGENVGFIQSFQLLVRDCDSADYYAYSDQDDVWYPEKIAMAIEMIEEQEKREGTEIPILYFSNYDFYDGEMNFLSHSVKPKIQPSFHNALVDCMTLGFNSVFNDAARRTICENYPQKSCGHDWWTYLVCIGLGKVIFDERPTVCYRRHDSNVSAGGMSFLKFQVWRFKKFFANDYFSNVHEMLKEFNAFYEGKLKKDDRALLSLFVKDNYSLVNALKKAFYRKKYRNGFFDEIAVRILFLIGKM